MGGLTKPQKITTPRDTAVDAFSTDFANMLNSIPGNLGSKLTTIGKLPAYTGPLSAPVVPGILSTANAANDAMHQFFYNGGMQFGNDILGKLAQFSGGQGPVQGSDVLSGIAQGLNPLNSQIQSLAQNAGNLQGSQQILDMVGRAPQGFQGAQGLVNPINNPALSGLLNAGVNSTEQGMLRGASTASPVGLAVRPISAALSGLQSLAGSQGLNNLLNTGGGTDFNSIFQALDAQRRQSLGTDVRDLREQFSNSGLRNSSALANAVGTRQTQSEQNLLADVSQLAPQLATATAQNRLGAAQALAGINSQIGGLGQTLGQLGLGAQQNTISGLSSAGQLGLNAAGLNLNALGQAGSLAQAEAARRSDLASQLAQIGLGARGQDLGALGQLGQLGLAANGQQIDALQNLLGAQAGAASQLGQFGIAQQGQNLQAALALPGAYTAINNLPYQLLGQNMDINQVLQGLSQSSLDRQYNEFQRQNSLVPGLLSFLGGTPAPAYGPSTLSTIGNLGIGAASAAAGLKG